MRGNRKRGLGERVRGEQDKLEDSRSEREKELESNDLHMVSC